MDPRRSSGLGEGREAGELLARAAGLTETGVAAFWSVLPAPYPIPDDGPVGDLLKAAARGPMRPAHLHFKVDAPGQGLS